MGDSTSNQKGYNVLRRLDSQTKLQETDYYCNRLLF